MAAGDLLGPGLVLLTTATLVAIFMVLARGLPTVRPAAIVIVSLIAACGLAAWGDDDLVNRQFGLVIVILIGLLALALFGLAVFIAFMRERRRSRS